MKTKYVLASYTKSHDSLAFYPKDHTYTNQSDAENMVAVLGNTGGTFLKWLVVKVEIPE